MASSSHETPPTHSLSDKEGVRRGSHAEWDWRNDVARLAGCHMSGSLLG